MKKFKTSLRLMSVVSLRSLSGNFYMVEMDYSQTIKTLKEKLIEQFPDIFHQNGEAKIDLIFQGKLLTNDENATLESTGYDQTKFILVKISKNLQSTSKNRKLKNDADQKDKEKFETNNLIYYEGDLTEETARYLLSERLKGVPGLLSEVIERIEKKMPEIGLKVRENPQPLLITLGIQPWQIASL
ncbi:hypothetical protein TRFO_16114 [Tritrichomonas foetus]|uniref:Ubiquitin-like domain-containing protein n=1 Tax=Tritrichomonas foetus TaxID=1144522 RepID=A0A1J4KS23_9EUKA|nr:hypothetical protein TRFO_16114 [Tritrichomonas foetus]|eukprot:OHT13680.1 hypothetical protein TRFO_16114 [Tritrichomonas foetus]